MNPPANYNPSKEPPLEQSMSADIARCVNEECAVRESCMRWVCRQDGHARVFMRGPLEPHGCRLFVGGGLANANGEPRSPKN